MMNLYDTYFSVFSDELVTDNFVWTDADDRLHINLGFLKERLGGVGLAIVEIDEVKEP
jgi:hypothetical protein